MQLPSAKEPARVDGPSIDSDEIELFHSPRRIGPALKIGGERLQVRVALAFLLLAAVPGIASGPAKMTLFALLLCSSLLVHELGHVLCGLIWCDRVAITLHALGAHTTTEPRLPRGRQSFATLAGSVISIAIGLAIGLLSRLLPGRDWLTIAMRINLVWGAVNLLPVLPFAGGRALLALAGHKRQSAVLLVSGSLALVLAIEGLVVVRSAAMIFIFGIAAFASLFRWSSRRRIEAEQALDLPKHLEAARAALAEDPERAKHLAERVAMASHSNRTENAAWEVVAWAELEQGQPEAASATLRRIRPASDVDVHCSASVEAARGHTRHAIGLLERARSVQGLSVDAIKFLIDLHAKLGALDAACAVASAEIAVLGPDDTQRVIEAAFDAGALSSATKLADELFAFAGPHARSGGMC